MTNRKMMTSTAARTVALTAIALSLAACTTVFESDKVDYKASKKAAPLDVPPDLTQLQKDNRYAVPDGKGIATASGFQQQRGAAPAIAAASGEQIGQVPSDTIRIERNGNQRWLVVKATPEQLWPQLLEFWHGAGFTVETESPQTGIMETNWAENRAKIPQDFIRRTIGKVFDSAYSTGERDKFRTRLERNANGGTEIYITHRGMIEVYSNTTKDTTVWQPRPSDPELETEFLRRLMVKLGVSQEQSKAVAAAPALRAQSARMATVNNQPVVQLDEGFDRAWRRVGLALDRTGFTVEDRNRNEGTYFVRYVAPNADKKEPGFFGKLFNSAPATPPLKYRIVVRSQGDSTTVSVLNEAGAPESSANAERIVRVITDDLK